MVGVKDVLVSIAQRKRIGSRGFLLVPIAWSFGGILRGEDFEKLFLSLR